MVNFIICFDDGDDDDDDDSSCLKSVLLTFLLISFFNTHKIFRYKINRGMGPSVLRCIVQC